MNTRRRSTVALSLLGSLFWSSGAFAYGGSAHQQILDEAWHTMRALSAPSLETQIRSHGMTGGSSADLTFDKPPSFCLLPANDPTNLCKETVTQAAWDDFRAASAVAMQKYYWQRPDLPRGSSDPACQPYQDADVLGNFKAPPDPGALQGGDEGCGTLRDYKRGVFASFRTEDDGTGNQGLLLGWQSVARDHDFDELSVDIMPVYGTLINVVSVAYEQVVGMIVLPFVCIFDLFTGGDCWNDSLRFADSVNPVDVVKGILPGFRIEEASKETGVFHFINPQSGLDNEYDDVQGLYYTQAGPDQIVGTIDESIIVGGDLLAMNIDASRSDGTERYELIDREVSSNKSSDRADWNWQSDWFGHVSFPPLDNLAYYGDANFPRGGHPGFTPIRGIHKYGWTLHAVSDATVPMHCAGTTSWGHRPYEDFVENHIDDLLFRAPVPGATPPPFSLEVNQLRQAQRVAARGFRWFRRGIGSDVRPFVTDIAKETLADLSLSGTHEGNFGVTDMGTGTIWCDACSYGYLMNNPKTSWEKEAITWSVAAFTDLDDDAMENPVEYYEAFRERIRTNVERASGASLAYLLARSGEAACRLRGQTCGGVQGPCCGSNSTCSSGTCQQVTPLTLKPNGDACSNGAECASENCKNGICEDTTGPGDVCATAADCIYGACSGGACVPGASGARCRDRNDCDGTLSCQNGFCISVPK
jgi:hypothetical protein